MTDTSGLERGLPWILRLVWIGVLLSGATAIDQATASRPDAIGDVATYAAFAAWFSGVCAMAVPAVASLTATRLLVPLAIPVSVVALAGGAEAVAGILFLVLTLVASAIAGSAIIGRAFVQASAYGEEDRHLLRPPAAYGLAALISWSLWAAALIATPLALADQRWVVGSILTGVSIAGGLLGWGRWHRLANRWFVVVPIGIVIFDQLVLAETVMLRRQEISGIRLAPAGTEAADLTGPASGHALEISTHEPITVIFAATPKRPRGNAIHLRSCLVAPSRPGQALKAAARRRLPVG